MQALIEYPSILMASFFPASMSPETLGIMALAVVAGLFLVKKLLRLAIFLGCLAGVVFLLESQGINVIGMITDALDEIPLHDTFNFLLGKS